MNTNCLHCGCSLPPARTGHRHRRYCGDTCRKGAYRARKAWAERHPELAIPTEEDAALGAMFMPSKDALDDAAHVLVLIRCAARLARRIVPDLPGSLPERMDKAADVLERTDELLFGNAGL